MVTANFIGCGKLGKTIASLFKTKKAAKILGICNRSLKSSKKSVNFIGEGTPYKNIEDLPPSDITFITTKDDVIEFICETITPTLKPGSIVVHCSGALSSNILKSAKKSGCSIASIHPAKSFANPLQCIHHFKGTYCAIEGDAKAVKILSTLFKKIGGNVFKINKKTKMLYHAAGVIANNYATTLHYAAFECYKLAGIDEKIAKKMTSLFMHDAIMNVENSSHQKALTGPIQRGDVGTVKNHIASLKDHKILKELYINLGMKTLELTTHSAKIIKEFEGIFSQKLKVRR